MKKELREKLRFHYFYEFASKQDRILKPFSICNFLLKEKFYYPGKGLLFDENFERIKEKPL